MNMLYGEFAGKLIFGSTGAGTTHYLTIFETGKSSPVLAMRAKASTDATECIFYAADQNGGVYMQMANGWVILDDDLGWLMLSEDFAQAATLYLDGSPNGQILQILNKQKQKCQVYYTVDNASPLLTINSGESQFAPTVITPSLKEIRAKGGWPQANFENVNLTGQDLSKLDFSNANFIKAILTDVNCDGATLDHADLSYSTLGQTNWGSPKSAKSVILSNCLARGATLNASENRIDFSLATLTGADFTGAHLPYLDLTQAQLGGALLIGATLDHGVLDKADLSNVVALSASIQNSSLKGINGQGANFVRATLSASDFGEARLGTKSYLFSLPGLFGDELDTYKYPQKDLIQAFSDQSVTLSPEAPMTVVITKQRWSIKDKETVYELVKNTDGTIKVFLDSANRTPAVFAGATCLGTKAQGASMAGVNLSGCLWYGAGSTLDHADLEGAVITDALMVETDFTQAFLSGANFNNTALILAKFKGCVIGSTGNQGSTSFFNAQLQGCDFSQSTLQNCLLVGAAVALPQGVPLFSLPLADQQYLTDDGLAGLKPIFIEAGHPLGSAPTIAQISTWSIDNSADPNTFSPHSYSVELNADGSSLDVFDASKMGYLFGLDANTYTSFLNQPTASRILQTGFSNNGYSLAAKAPITSKTYWELKPDHDAPWVRSTAYPTMQIFEAATQLNVFGATTVKLRDYLQIYSEIAFGGTQNLETALSANSIGPAGYPRLLVDNHTIDWLAYFTCRYP